MPEKLTKKELQKLARLGRRGDTELAHVNKFEKQMLKRMGGSGTINPYTGLREYGLLGDLWEGIKGFGEALYDAIIPSGKPGSSILEQLGSGLGLTSNDWFAGPDPVRVPGPDDELDPSDILVSSEKAKKAADYRKSLKSKSQSFKGAYNPGGGSVQQQGGPAKSGLELGYKWDLQNPFIQENVEKFAQGGDMGRMAEFTGDELIVNNQNAVEQGIATNNYKMTAGPIRDAMNRGYITPGRADHRTNPLTVDASGKIYDKGGKALGFNVNKGAGIYDNASKQFNPFMTDKQIHDVAKKNVNKWKQNDMYS